MCFIILYSTLNFIIITCECVLQQPHVIFLRKILLQSFQYDVIIIKLDIKEEKNIYNIRK